MYGMRVFIVDQWCSAFWSAGPDEWCGACLWAGLGPRAWHHLLPAPHAGTGPWELGTTPSHPLHSEIRSQEPGIAPRTPCRWDSVLGAQHCPLALPTCQDCLPGLWYHPLLPPVCQDWVLETQHCPFLVPHTEIGLWGAPWAGRHSTMGQI